MAMEMLMEMEMLRALFNFTSLTSYPSDLFAQREFLSTTNVVNISQ